MAFHAVTRRPGFPGPARHGASETDQGRVHAWLAEPAQSQICNRVPSAEELPVASRQRPELALTRRLFAPGVQDWAPVPLQSQSCTFVPLAVPAEVTSMHLPSAWNVLPTCVQFCAAVPLHVHSWIAVPLAVFAPETSTHLPPIPWIGP